MKTLASIRKEIEELKAVSSMEAAQHIWFHESFDEIFTSDEKFPHHRRPYCPSPTGIELDNSIQSKDNFVICVMGPYGSGKSTMCMRGIVKLACLMPVWYHGRRRSRFAFIRNTSGELYSTTLKTWLSWYGELGDITKRQKPILTYEHLFSDGNGLVELEILFVALDRPDHVRKLKSLELTGAFLNETCELPQDVLSHIKGRINGRYPSKGFCSEYYWKGLICDTNPPDTDHWIYRDFVESPVEGYKLIRQPPGLLLDEKGKYIPNLGADNMANLSEDYYTRLATGQREGFVKVFCQGEFGLVELGKRVYEEYNDDIHSIDHIEPILGLPIHLGWDFGLTPACVVVQITPRGQVRVLKEYVSDRMGIRNFAKMIVIPALKIDFAGFKIGFSYADPAGTAADSIMEELSCIGELNSLGISTFPALTNDPTVRQAAVRFFLNAMSDGKVTFLVSRMGAPVIRKGFVSGYVLKRLRVSGEERYAEEPTKNSFSHPHDALQYILLHFAGLQIENERPSLQIDMTNPTFRGMQTRRF